MTFYPHLTDKLSAAEVLRGGGEPAEPGLSGERTAYSDGGMSDGGQDGVEEGPH